MKESLLIISIFLAIIMSSCQKEELIPLYPFEAEVLGVNSDCGNYAIKILKGLPEIVSIVGPTTGDSIYIAKNLPNELEIEELIICLDLRAPENDELGICTFMGPTYNWVFVKNAMKK